MRRPRIDLNNFLHTANTQERRVYRMMREYDFLMSTHVRSKTKIGNVQLLKNKIGNHDPRVQVTRWNNFVKALELCEELEVDTNEFLKAQFSEMKRAYGFAPYPNQLYGGTAIERLLVHASSKQVVPNDGVSREEKAARHNKMVRKARKREGVSFDELQHILEGVLAGIYPKWYAKHRLGRGWKKNLTKTQRRMLEE